MKSGFYPISVVSEQTGVNPITLRAWERRHKLINPMRTAAGHRLYSETDIALIKKILEMLAEGVTLSRVSEALIRQGEGQESSISRGEVWRKYQSEMIHAIVAFDEARLETNYNEAMSLYSINAVTRELLLPLLQRLGDRWSLAPTGIAEEHFFSVYMRNKLGARFHHRNLTNTGPRIVAACLPGEQHEFGLLLFALAAHTRGYQVVLLGADTPLQQLSHVLKRSGSQALVLSGSSQIISEELDNALATLTQKLKYPVFIGGGYVEKRAKTLEKYGVHVIGDDLVVGLNTLDAFLRSQQKNRRKSGSD